jgi:hypothetical protein
MSSIEARNAAIKLAAKLVRSGVVRRADSTSKVRASNVQDMIGNKHDADCLRRKAEIGWQYICTCRLSDEQVAEAARAWGRSTHTKEETG